MRLKSTGRNQSSRHRAFTLLEVAVATALTGLLMVMVLQWVGQLARSGALGGVQRQAERDVQWVYTNMARDAAAAGPCDLDGLKPALSGMSATTLGLFVDADEDGVRDLVTWSVANGAVVRSVQLATAPCVFATTRSDVVLTDMVRAGTTTVFQPISGGVVSAAPSSAVSCLASVQSCATSGSQWAAARVMLVLAKADGTPLAKLDDAFSWVQR